MTTTTKTVRQTVNALVNTYKKDIEKAAGDKVLSAREQSKLSPWAKSHIAELRQETDTVTVGKAVAHLKPIIQRAAEAIAGGDGKIDAADVAKLRVTELRTRAAGLFDDGGSAGGMTLKKALDGANIPLMTDYGHNFSQAHHAANATVASIIAGIVDVSEEDLGRLTEWGDVTNGAAAVKEFGDTLRATAKDRADNAETPAEAASYKKAFGDVAAAAKTFFNADDFKKFVFGHHSISEDGDMEYNILMAQKRDGTWQSLTYTNFPF